MPRLMLCAAMVVLAACARPPLPYAAFRSLATPIYSNATFDFGRLPGTWSQAATFGRGCAPGQMTVSPDGTMRARLCLDGTVTQTAGRIAPSGPGRFHISGGVDGPLSQEWWVVWVDTGYRTLAIGTPSGTFGFVLNRDGPLPADRLTAAAEIFDFNGYDRSRLARLP